jgi:CxxC motif-containing protein (DUF1111 family)
VRNFSLLVLAAFVAGACSELLTSAPDDADLFDAPLEGLTASELASFVRGDEEFGRRFSAASGLGPAFNNVSCASCHSGDGRGRLENSLFRIGSDADDFLTHLGGPQIQDKAIAGYGAEPVPAGVAVSVRLPPPVFGAGLIEAIPEAAILANADENDANGDGISGRPNWVRALDYVPHTEQNGGTALRIGRFGRKAQTSTILQQTVEAYHQDMGITSEFRPSENRNPLATSPVETHDHAADPEISTATVQAVVHYLRVLAPPAPGGSPSAGSGAEQPVTTGQSLFASVGCAQCHTPTLTTGAHTIAALAHKPATLYSDLLLHDMGDALADNRPDGGASGREWRTTPLWGLRLMRQFLNGQAFLMHDGRARTVEEAILLHGGEGLKARNAFAALSASERAALLAFVESR